MSSLTTGYLLSAAKPLFITYRAIHIYKTLSCHQRVKSDCVLVKFKQINTMLLNEHGIKLILIRGF